MALVPAKGFVASVWHITAITVSFPLVFSRPILKKRMTAQLRIL
jgi:hypothetical protein